MSAFFPLNLKLSYSLLGFLLFTHISAAVILYLTFQFGVSFYLGMAGIILSLGYYIARHIWQVKYSVWYYEDFLRVGFVSTGLMIVKTRGRRGWLVLCQDMADADTCRRLRVFLKKGKENLSSE